MAWEIVTNSKTAAFKDIVQKQLVSGGGKVYLVVDKEVAGEKLFADLSMQVMKNVEGYSLVVLKSRYDRLEYEKFLRMAKEKGADLGSNLWLTMQLTFPLEFWSVPKQNSILNKIARQQFCFLAYLLNSL